MKMSKKGLAILIGVLVAVGVAFFMSTRTPSEPVQDIATVPDSEQVQKDLEETDPNPLADKPIVDPDMNKDHEKVYGHDFDESLDVIPEADRPNADQSAKSISFAKEWLTYNSDSSYDDRVTQLSKVSPAASDLAEFDPVSLYLCDTRDNSGWTIISSVTGEAKIDPRRSRVYPDRVYMTVDIPVHVKRIDRETQRVMSGDEVFHLDLDLEKKNNDVVKIGSPNDWMCEDE